MSVPLFVLWQTARTGRLKIRFGPVYDAKRQPTKFRIYLAIYAVVFGGMFVIMLYALTDRCAGN